MELQGPWSDLHDDFLDEITKWLSAIDYLMFGCVCRSWRSYVEKYKKNFMKSQPPLIVFLSEDIERACYFYSIFNRRLYRAILPSLIGKSCSGITCGYLVLVDNEPREDSQFWLLNPFTRHELRFPCPSNFIGRVILTSLAMPLREFVLIAFCRYGPCLQYCRSSDTIWTICDSRDRLIGEPVPWIVDGAVFKGKIYVLTGYGEIGVLNLNPHPYVTMLKVKGIGQQFYCSWQLIRCNEQLIMMRETSYGKYQVYELNILKMEWVKMQNFGDQALFFSNSKGSGFFNPTRWIGSQQPCNCIYCVECIRGQYILRFLDGRHPMSFPMMPPIMQGNHLSDASPFETHWYFPNVLQCGSSL